MTASFDQLLTQIEALYLDHNQELVYHGWHHINFVLKKSIEFSKSINADTQLVKAAALTHDLNYLIEPNSKPESATKLRSEILSQNGYSQSQIDRIESIIMEAHTAYRTEKISPEGMALADADNVYKILPINPIMFSGKYITQNHVDIHKLAQKITSEQNPLMAKGIFFNTELAKKKYLGYAKTNLQLWNSLAESFSDPDVAEILAIAKENGII